MICYFKYEKNILNKGFQNFVNNYQKEKILANSFAIILVYIEII